jgi:entericidin B
METNMYTKLLALTLAVSFVLSGCNTIQGAGKDLERGGEKIQDSAEKA